METTGSSSLFRSALRPATVYGGTLACSALVAATLLALPTSAQVVDLPPDATNRDRSEPSDESPPEGVWGMEEERRSVERRTVVGGYGEVHYNTVIAEGSDAESTIDVHRLVVFLSQRFTDQLSFYGELEVEHAFVSSGGPGEVGVEQAFVDYNVAADVLGIRAGVVLVPMGFINHWHEPPMFNGVERPRVDNRIIPTTWREGGIGIFGEPVEGLSYELYAISGLDPLGFSAGGGIRGGRQHVAKAVTTGVAVTGRVQYEPTLGVSVGIAGYFGNSGPNAGDTYRDEGDGAPDIQPFKLRVPVAGVALDARLRRSGVEARGLLAYFSIGNTDELRNTLNAAGESIGPDVGSSLFGAYLELGYNVFHNTCVDHELVPFVRYEFYDTAFTSDDDYAGGERGTSDYVFGLTWRPIRQVAFKTNVTLRRPNEGTNSTLIDAGVGWMF